MECREVRRLLPALLDGELPQPARDEVEAHLAHCRDCRRVYDDYRRDQQVLSYHLRTAPWLPVTKRPWEQERAGRAQSSRWSWLASGGNKVAAGVALLALLALITGGALALRGMSNGPGEPGTVALMTSTAAGASTMLGPETTSATLPANASYPAQIIAELSAHGLAFKINKQATIDGKKVTFDRLIVDRSVTYLEYTMPGAGPLPAAVNLVDASGASELGRYGSTLTAKPVDPTSPTPIEHWMVFPGLDPSTKQVTLSIDRGPLVPLDIPVTVNLAPLRDMPEPVQLRAEDSSKGIDLTGLTLTRGLVVTRLDWKATISDQNRLQLVDQPVHVPNVEEEMSVHASGASVSMVNSGETTGASDVEGMAEFIGVPAKGTLTLTIGWLDVGQRGGASGHIAVGPWTLTIDLSNPGNAQPQPTATPRIAEVTSTPAATPVSTPTVAATPTATAPVTVSSALPAGLYFVAPAKDGVQSFWEQPQDKSSAPKLILHPDADIDAYWPVPGSNRVIFRQSGDGQVYLLNVDSHQTQRVAVDAAEAVPSPDGSQIAYISPNQQTLSIGSADTLTANGTPQISSIYVVDNSQSETIHGLHWSPSGKQLMFQLSQIAGNTVEVVTNPEPNGVVWQSKGDVMSAAFSPDGTQLVYSTGSAIVKVNLADGKETDLTPDGVKGGQQALLNVTWRPDDRIGFIAHQDQTVYSPADLWLMKSDGSQAWKAHPGLGAVLDFRWSPRPGSDGFVVGLSQAPGESTSQASGLIWYPALHSGEKNQQQPQPDPVTLGQGAVGQPVDKLEWAGK